ncbi:MAG: hypothetical protein JKX72_02005 [Robiginitomaculum sp.]|nr:hypothetical protein [Robiginitomaculum sp.]
MTEQTKTKRSVFDFGAAISQLFTQNGGYNFAARLVLWTAALMGLAFALLAKPYMNFMSTIITAQWASNTNSDPEAILSAYGGMGKLILPMLLATLLMWMIYASAETALHKKHLRNFDHGFFPLRFGRDELRVMGTQFLVYVAAIAAFIVMEIILIALFTGTALASTVHILFGIIVGLFALIALLALFVIPVHIAVRLAPSAAIGVKENRFAPFSGWDITKGRTSYLFLAYLFSFIAGYVVISIIQITAMGFVLSENYMLVVMGYSEQNPQEIFASMAEKLKSPGIIFGLVVGAVLYFCFSILWWLSICGIGTYAVKWWDGDNLDTNDE